MLALSTLGSLISTPDNTRVLPVLRLRTTHPVQPAPDVAPHPDMTEDNAQQRMLCATGVENVDTSREFAGPKPKWVWFRRVPTQHPRNYWQSPLGSHYTAE